MMTHDDWLRERKTGIGGSDIAAIAGVSPYAGPLDVYLDKLGFASRKEETLAMKLGTRLEPIIGELYQEQTGRELVEAELTRHPLFPWALGTPDRLVRGAEMGVEFKTAGIRSAAQWGEGEDAAPPRYIVQCQWYMAITGYRRWDLAVLIGGQDFRIYPLMEDPQLQSHLLEIGGRFWREHILSQTPPPVDGSPAWGELVARTYRTHSEEMIGETPTAREWATRLATARVALREAEERERLAMTQLKELIGPHAGIQGDGWSVTWKKTKDSTVTDWKALAQTLHPKPELVQQFSTTKEGARRFLFTAKEIDTNGK